MVTHLGSSFDTKDITAASSGGWSIELYAADGVTVLVDTNGNGTPDTGELPSGGSTGIVVKVTVPADGLAGEQDVTTVRAVSGRNPTPGNTDTATDTTTVSGVLTLSLSTTAVLLGQVTPDGVVDPSVTGVTSVADAAGAYYVKTGAVQVTVASNGPWTGACRGGENTGTASTIRVAAGRFEWRLAGDTGWVAFLPGSLVQPYDNSCFQSRAVGSNGYVYDFRLRVEWTDDPGTFQTSVTLGALQ